MTKDFRIALNDALEKTAFIALDALKKADEKVTKNAESDGKPSFYYA